MLRIIIDQGGHKEFIDNKKYFNKDDIAHFLEAGKYVDMDEDDFNRQDPINILGLMKHLLFENIEIGE